MCEDSLASDYLNEYSPDRDYLLSKFPYDFTCNRGGVKYTTKGTNVTRTLTQLEADFKAMQERHEREANRMLEEIRKVKDRQLRPEPDVSGVFSIGIKFSPSGEVYQYAIVRLANGKLFTTGTGEEKQFDNWDQFLGWLDTVYWHGSLYRTNSVIEVMKQKDRLTT